MLLTLGYALIGIAPLGALFVALLANKSFLVLVTFLSAFYWLVVISLTAAVFRAFLPLEPAASSYAGFLVVAVCIEEAARLGLWAAHRSILSFLRQYAQRTDCVLRQVDAVYLAIAWGVGHAATHSFFFFVSFLPLTLQGGTWYLDTCPAMNVFLASSLLSLGFDILLVSLSVVALEGGKRSHAGYSRLEEQPSQQLENLNLHNHHQHQHHQHHQQQQEVLVQVQQPGVEIEGLWDGIRLKHMGAAALMHVVAALMMLLSFAHNGCVASVTLLLAVGLVSAAYAGKVLRQSRRVAGLRPLPEP